MTTDARSTDSSPRVDMPMMGHQVVARTEVEMLGHDRLYFASARSNSLKTIRTLQEGGIAIRPIPRIPADTLLSQHLSRLQILSN
jgi:hypothetical protein